MRRNLFQTVNKNYNFKIKNTNNLKMKKTPRHPIYRCSSKSGEQVHINDLKAYCQKFGLNYKTVFSQISTSSLGYSDEVRTIRRLYLTDVNQCTF